MATIICRGCRMEINTANNYCSYCELKVGVIGCCPNCGQELRAPANNCYHCNTPLPEALQDLTPEKSSDPKPVSRTVSANYFLMHWRGELSLGVAYWGNFFFLTMIFSFLGVLIDQISLTSHPIVSSRLAFSFYMFIIFILYPWQIVGTWRTCKRGREGVKTSWGILVQVIIVFGVLGAIRNLQNNIPIYTDLFHLAFDYKKDGFQDYKVQLTNNKSFIHITGSLGFGVSEELEEILEKHPKVNGVILDSRGGRIYEGRELAKTIKREGLDTYSLKGCHSACATAFIVGKKRYLGTEANIGFHQYRGFGSAEGLELELEQESDLQFFTQAGVKENIIQRIFKTSSEDFWYPTINQMLDGNVIHGVVNASDLSPIKYQAGLVNKIPEVFADIPIYRAIKKYDLKTYNLMVQSAKEQMQKGASAVEVQNTLGKYFEKIAIKTLPKASNDTLFRFAEIFKRILEKTNNESPISCMKFLYPKEYGSVLFTQFVPKNNLYELNSIMNQVIIDSYELKEVPVFTELAEAEMGEIAEKALSMFEERESLFELKNLQNQEDYRTHCKMYIEIFTQLLKEDKGTASNLLRYLFSML
jgi:hypothetical protein